MNALTKAFVVVVTILSVVLVTLVVSFAARVPDYRQQATDLKQSYEAQLAKARDTAADVRTKIAAKGTEVEALALANSQLTSDLDQANNALKALQAQLDQSSTTVARNSAALEIAVAESSSKSQSLAKLNELISEQLATISDLTGQRSDLSQILIEERGKVRRLTDSYQRLQEENKAFEQQLLESQAQLKTALDRLAGFVNDVEQELAKANVQPGEGIAIRGSVTQINQITDDVTLVQVNVGTRDLVKEGMEFTVSRGDQFVGKIVIDSVDTAEAVGQLTLGGGIQEGDKVQAGNR